MTERRRDQTSSAVWRWVAAAVVGLAVLGLAVVAALVMATEPGEREPGRGGSPSAPAGSAPPTTGDLADPTGDLADPPSDEAPLALGAVTNVFTSGAGEDCPLDTCQRLTVACPGLPETNAIVALRSGDGPPRGLVAFFSGGTGRGWWAAEGVLADADVLAQVGRAGLETAMVRWVDGWAGSARQPVSQAPGMASVACRPATVVRWLHDERYAPMGLSPEVGICGFCVTGNSGGASQAAYSLTHYGLASIVDAAILSSGPPHAALAKGCLRNAGEEEYWYDPQNTEGIDAAYTTASGAGPCAGNDSDMERQWVLDGVDTGGSDYSYETTRVTVILGSKDPTVAPAHARDFIARLRASGSPWVTDETVETGSHSVTSSREGRQLLVDALLGAP